MGEVNSPAVCTSTRTSKKRDHSTYACKARMADSITRCSGLLRVYGAGRRAGRISSGNIKFGSSDGELPRFIPFHRSGTLIHQAVIHPSLYSVFSTFSPLSPLSPFSTFSAFSSTIPQSLTRLFRDVLTLPSLLPNFSSCLMISIPSMISPNTTCFPLLISSFFSSRATHFNQSH